MIKRDSDYKIDYAKGGTFIVMHWDKKDNQWHPLHTAMDLGKAETLITELKANETKETHLDYVKG